MARPDFLGIYGFPPSDPFFLPFSIPQNPSLRPPPEPLPNPFLPDACLGGFRTPFLHRSSTGTRRPDDTTAEVAEGFGTDAPAASPRVHSPRRRDGPSVSGRFRPARVWGGQRPAVSKQLSSAQMAVGKNTGGKRIQTIHSIKSAWSFNPTPFNSTELGGLKLL